MESKKEYLRRILDVKKDDSGYAEMDTFIREYNNFISAFNFDEIRGGEIETIFVEFHKKGITPAKLVKLQKGKKRLEKQLSYYSRKARGYYICEIRKDCREKICGTNRPKDIPIALANLNRNHNLVGNFKKLPRFLQYLNELWIDFMDELYSVVDLIFSGRYEADFIRTDEFDKVVDEEIMYYQEEVKKYEKSFEKPECYYNGKNDNPYKNIFIYCLNAYIRKFYQVEIPTMTPGQVDNLKKMIWSEQKEKYTLEDVASVYAEMSGEVYKKAYSKIKQQFRKSPFMRKMKKGRFYEFDCLEIPLATYIYYSKKNHHECKDLEPFSMYDNFIVYYYAPLLRANMNGEYEKLRAFNKYVEFVNSELKKLTSTVNDAYLETCLEKLFSTSLRLNYRCNKGFDVERVIEGKIRH